MPEEKNQKMFWGLLVAGAIAFVLVLAFANPGAEEDIAQQGGEAAAVDIVVAETDWTLGNPDAAVTLVEYADFQCPACAAYHSVVKEVMEEYGDRVQYVYRHFPLTRIHPQAIPAAQASEAAGVQGKFFEMQDLLYTRQGAWSRNGVNTKAIFEEYAGELGLDIDQFNADYASDAVSDKVSANLREAQNYGLGSTPTFILDNRVLTNPPGNAEAFASILDQRLKYAELLSTSESSEE